MNSVDTIERVIARMNTSNLLNQLYHSSAKSTNQAPKNCSDTGHVKSVNCNMGFDQKIDESKKIGDFKSPFPKGFEQNEMICVNNKEMDKKSIDSEIMNSKNIENKQLNMFSSNMPITETLRPNNNFEVDYNSYNTGKIKSKGSIDLKVSSSNKSK